MTALKVAKAPIEKVDRVPVVFENEETWLKLAGIVYKPRNLTDWIKLPAITVWWPMWSVKELAQSLYAMRLAEKWYITMVYDHSYVWSSEWHPRWYEDPEIKWSDIRSAISYLLTLPYVDKEKIASIWICWSWVYVPNAVKEDSRVKAVISIVPFTIMNTIVTASDEDLLKMKNNFENGNEPDRLELITPDSEWAKYYFNTDRWASANMIMIPTWSQLTWHDFHPEEEIKKLKAPYLVITSENAFTRQWAEFMFENANQPKEFHMIKNATHFDMYDIEEYVEENIDTIINFFKKYL